MDHHPTAAPIIASPADPGTPARRPRRWRARSVRLASAIGAIALVLTLGGSVSAFGDLEVVFSEEPAEALVAGMGPLPTGFQPKTGFSAEKSTDLFEVTVTNLRGDPPDTEPVIFEYRPPKGVVITFIESEKGPCEVGTEGDPSDPDPTRCELGQLAPDEEVVITIEYFITADTPRRTLIDHDVRAYLVPIGTEEDPPDNQNHFFTLVETLADLEVGKTGPDNGLSHPDIDPPEPSTMKAGTSDFFTLKVTNNGPSVARSVLVNDFVPMGMRIINVKVVDAETSMCDIDPVMSVPRLAICEMGDIAPGDTRIVDVQVFVDPDVPDGAELTDEAQVASSMFPPMDIGPAPGNGDPAGDPDNYAGFTPGPPNTPDYDIDNNIDQVITTIFTIADMSIEKVSDPDKVYAGEQKRYTLKVTNNGPSDALNPDIRDFLPGAVDYEIDTDLCFNRVRELGPPDPKGYTVTDSNVDPYLGRDGPQDGHDIDDGDPPPLPLPYEPDNPGMPFFDISGTGTAIGAFNGGGDDGSAQVPIGFSFRFYDDLDETFVWVSTNGFIKFGSGGPETRDPDNDCPLSDSTPNRAIYAFWDDLDVTGGDVYFRTVTNPDDPPNRVFIVQWTDVTIVSSGDQISFQIQLYEGSNAIRIVYGPGIGATPAASGESATVGIEPRDDLIDDGNGITYNCGDDNDPAPPFLDENLVVVFADNDTWDPAVPDETICRVGERVKAGTRFTHDGVEVTHVMPPGDMRTFDIWARVDPSTPPGTVITNTAVVTASTTLGDPTTMVMEDNFQPFGGNNTATAKNLVLQKADLKVTKFGKPDRAVRAGEVLTYTIVVDNYGPSWADDVAIKDILQASGTFDLIDINTDRNMVCTGIPGPDRVRVRPEEWPIRRPPPAFGVDDDTGERNIRNRLELDCTLTDDPDTGFPGMPMEENRLEALEADGPPNSGRWIVTLRVRAAETQSINNIVDVLSPIALDPNRENNHAEVEHEITDVADLSISKSDVGEDPFKAGTDFEYGILVTNDGPSMAENVVVVDTLPLELSVVTIHQPGNGSCGTVQGEDGNVRVTCMLDTIPAGEARVITIRVHVPSDVPDGTVLFNQAVVSSDIFDPDNSENISVARSEISAMVDLKVSKKDTPDPVVAGQELQYLITAENRGPSDAQDVRVIDDLPADVELVSAGVIGGTGSCAALPLQKLTCQLGTLKAGATAQIAVVVRVDPDVPCGSDLINDVHIESTTAEVRPDPSPNQDNRRTEVDCEAGLTVTKTASTLTPIAGENYAYTVQVKNNGPSLARNVIATDTLPPDVSYVFDTFGCGSDLVGGGCPLGDILPGEEIAFTMFVRLQADAPCNRVLTNELEVTSSTAPTALASADVNVKCQSDLRVLKYGKPDRAVRAGEVLTYTVFVDNLGPSDATDGRVVLVDEFTSNGTFDILAIDPQANGQQASCVPVGPVNGVAGRQTIRCTLNEDLKVFPSERWELQLRVRANQDQTINNVADVTSTDARDPNAANNRATVEHAITDVADLSVSKTDNGGPFVAGTDFTYTVRVRNDGPSAAENVVATDDLPLGVAVVGITPPQAGGGCSLVQGTLGNVRVVCHLGTLAANSADSVALRVRVAPELPEEFVLFNRACATSDVFDPDNSDQCASARSDVVARADLDVEKVAQPDPIVSGQPLEYRIVVRNGGPSVARRVTVQDVLAAGLQARSAAVTDRPGAYCTIGLAGPSTVDCFLGDLAPLEQVEVRIDAAVDPGVACDSVIENWVTATSPTPTVVVPPATLVSPQVVTASAATVVICRASLGVRKTVSDYSPVAGGNLVYTIEVTNRGPSVARDVVAVDTLPPDVQVLFDTQGCGPSLFGAGCSLGDLPPGGEIRFDVIVRVEAAAECGVRLTNTVEVGSTTAATVSARATVAVECESDLRVLKYGKPDGRVLAGEVLTYTVFVDNLGPSVAWPADVVLVDDLTSNGVFDILSIDPTVGGRLASCTPPGPVDDVPGRQTIRCTLEESLELFPTERWEIRITVRADQTQTINNVADVISTGARDPDLTNNRATVAHTVTDVADLYIAKRASGGPFVAGTEFDYTLRVGNDGPSTATDVVVHDDLPLGLSVVSITRPSSASCGPLQTTAGNIGVDCFLGTLAAGATREITLRVRVAPDVPDGTVLFNQACVASDVLDRDNSDQCDFARAVIVARADLDVEKSAVPDPLVAGEQEAYEVLVKNKGPSMARAVVVRDRLDPFQTAVAAMVVNKPGAYCTIETTVPHTVECYLGDLAPGEIVTVRVTARLDPAAPCEQLLENQVVATTPTADLGGGTPQVAVANAVVGIACRARLSLVKTVSDFTPVAGQHVVYTIRLSNAGPSVAHDVVATDTLPADVVYQLDTQGCGAALFGAGCGLGDLAPGQTISFQVLVKIDVDARCNTRLTNTVTASSTTAPAVSASADVQVTCQSDLRVLKYGKPDRQVRAGEVLTYTVFVDNLGPSETLAGDVVLADELTASGVFDILSIDPTVGGRVAACVPAGPVSGVSGRQSIRCALGESLQLFPAERWEIRLTVRANQTQSINNVADVSVTSATDPNSANNRATVEHDITDVADLSISKTDGGGPFVAGTELDYRLQVRNDGPSTAENVVVRDDLPLGVSVVRITAPAGGACSTVQAAPGNLRVTCTLGTLAKGATRDITVRVRVAPDVPDGTILFNEACVDSDHFDPDNSDQCALARSEIVARANLGVEKNALPDPVVAGEQLAFEVVVTNRGPSMARGVELQDILDANLAALAAFVVNKPGAGCTIENTPQQTVECFLGDLLPGATVRIRVTTKVDPATPCDALIQNRVAVSSPTADVRGHAPQTVVADAAVAVDCRAQVTIAKTADESTPVAGTQLAFTIRVTNRGPSVARQVVVTDTLPAGLEPLINTLAGCSNGNLFSPGGGCSLGDLAPGETVTFRIIVNVAADSDCEKTLVNTATVAWNDHIEDQVVRRSARATAAVFVICRADLRVRKFGKPDASVRAGDVLTYTVIVDNLGPSFASGVALKDVLQSSGVFRVLGIDSDRSTNCDALPDAAAGDPFTIPPEKGAVSNVPGRYQVDCTLDGRLGVVTDVGGPPNRGRWILTMRVRADQNQDINNVARVLGRTLDPDNGNNEATVEHEITDVADLAVSKSDSPDPVVAGQVITYTVRITNTGPSDAENVRLIDRLPPGVTVTGVGTSNGATCATGTAGSAVDRLTCGLGTLHATGAVTTAGVTVVARVGADVQAGTLLENDVFVTADVFDDNNANNFDAELTQVGAVADLTLDKTAVGAPIAGRRFTYRYEVRNLGTSVARNVSLQDVLPPQVELVDAYVDFQNGLGGVPLACGLEVGSNGTLCPLGDIPVMRPSDPPIVVLVNVQVKPNTPAGTDLVNTARLVADTFDPTPAQDSVTVKSQAIADLEIQKTSSPVKVNAGEQKKYTLRVKNHGPSDAQNVVVQDTLPSQVRYEIDTALCSDAGQVVTCAFGTLPAGAERQFELYGRVDPATAPGTILQNRAQVASTTAEPSPDPSANSVLAENLVLQQADLKVTKFGKRDGRVRAGEILTYTVVVDNLGPSFANSVALKDILQSSGVFDVLGVTSDRPASCASQPAPGGGSPFTIPPEQGAVTVDQRYQLDCTLTSPLAVLSPSGGPPNPGRWILTLRVRATQTQDVNNIAVVQSDVAADPDRTNNMAAVEHAITDVADLRVTKTARGENTTAGCPPGTSTLDNLVTAGRRLVYTVVVTNDGPSDAENVVLADRLPPGVTVVDGPTVVSPAAGQLSCTTGTPGSAQDRLVCGVAIVPPAADPNPKPRLKPGQSVTLQLTVLVDAGIGGAILENDVSVTSGVFDNDTADNFAFNRTTVNAVADLAVTKVDSPDPVVAGRELQVAITVSNTGPSDAKNVLAVDVLPNLGAGRPLMDFLRAEGAACRQDLVSTERITCYVGDLAAGRSQVIYLTTRVKPDAVPSGLATTSLTNSVTVFADTNNNGTSDPVSASNPNGDTILDPCLTGATANTALAVTTANRQSDVFVTKLDTPDPVVAGRELAYVVTFGNNGPSTATSVDVRDTLPRGVRFNRCEPIDPNDEVACQVVSGDGNTSGQVVRLLSIEQADSIVYSATLLAAGTPNPANDLDPGETYRFRLVADVESGYVLNARGDTASGQACRAYFLATGYPHFAHNRVTVTALSQAGLGEALLANNLDDECTRVDSSADLTLTKVDDLDGFLRCDPVQPGGMITYDLTVTNRGPSDAAQVVVTDWLPPLGVALDPAQVSVTVIGGQGQVVDADPNVAGLQPSRDDGLVTVIVGNDRNAAGVSQLGRLNRGSSVRIRLQVMVGLMAECGALLTNRAAVETRLNNLLWPTGTPTEDPDPSNNSAVEQTRVECPRVKVEKTVSYNGRCPGAAVPTVARTGQQVTFCIEVTNTGTTHLDRIVVTDTLRTSMQRTVFTRTLVPKDPKFPLMPGEAVTTTFTVPSLTDMCGTVTNTADVSAIPTNSGKTVFPCLAPVRDTDRVQIFVPCAGADYRLQLPALNNEECDTWIQVQNVGRRPGRALLVLWGEAGACPPQAAGPLKMECTGLLKPGSAWTFDTSRLPPGIRSGIVYSVNAIDLVRTPQGNLLEFADVACRYLFQYVVGSDDQWTQFDTAYQSRGIYLGPFDSSGLHQLELDFGAHQGEPLVVSVNRTCPDAGDPNRNVSAAYAGVSSDAEGVMDPRYGAFMYYAPLVFANKGGLNSWLYLHNSGLLCTSIEIWFKGQDNCLRPILGDVLALSPGESAHVDPNAVVGPDWVGSAWIRSSQPLGIVVDTMGPNHFTSYRGVPADSFDAGFSLGSQVNYAPLVYSEFQGWDSAIQVQNLSAVVPAKVKVYFLDRSGDIVTTLVDWICPRGSQTFFLPLIDSIPGNWVGSARVESQEWWTPGGPVVDPPRILSVVLLEKWSDPARTERREAIAYNALTEPTAFDWQLGKGRGGTASGSAVIAVPILAKSNNRITSELAITNLVPKPGFTDFVIFIFDQNGFIDQVCEKLNEKQVEYIDLATWGYVPPRFLGSAVISATFWEHDVFDGSGQFRRNLVGLGAVVIERVDGILGGPDVPGDEAKGFEAIPIFNLFNPPDALLCPGVPPGARP
jgi:uncharacterized repeat protein (TIGR01451 family)